MALRHLLQLLFRPEPPPPTFNVESFGAQHCLYLHSGPCKRLIRTFWSRAAADDALADLRYEQETEAAERVAW
jgi:hypothetical protein